MINLSSLYVETLGQLCNTSKENPLPSTSYRTDEKQSAKNCNEVTIYYKVC